MFERELVDLSEHSGAGGGTRDSRGRQGWSLVTGVWDSRGRKLLGYLRIESTGGVDDFDLVTELEEAPFAG